MDLKPKKKEEGEKRKRRRMSIRRGVLKHKRERRIKSRKDV